MRIGAATPTVRPSPMLMVPRIFVLGGRVAKVPASGTVVPSTPFALPPQVYVTPYRSLSVLAQDFLSAASVPATGPLGPVRVTASRVPSTTLTFAGCVGSVPVAPVAGT